VDWRVPAPSKLASFRSRDGLDKTGMFSFCLLFVVISQGKFHHFVATQIFASNPRSADILGRRE
jgi:hypothetical protein